MTSAPDSGMLVDHAGLDQAADDLRRKAREIDQRLDRLESELAPLRSDWTGRAQEAYLQAKATWDAAMTEMRELLDDTARAVTVSNADYAAADARGAATFGA